MRVVAAHHSMKLQVCDGRMWCKGPLDAQGAQPAGTMLKDNESIPV